MERQISQKIVSNTKYNALGSLWTILVGFLLTPYIIGHIGIERFGLLAVVGAMTGYFGLLDFGIGTSFVKYIAQFYARKEFERINELVASGFVFYSIFSVAILGLAFFSINFLIALFKIPEGLREEASWAILLGIIGFGISGTFSVFGALQGGLQRMEVSNLIAMLMSIPNVLGIIFFLEKGYGLRGLLINNVIVFLLNGIINTAIAHRIFPEFRFHPAIFATRMFLKLFDFGYKVQVSRIADIVVFQTSRLVIAHFLNLFQVSYYQLGSVITQKMRELPLLLASALLPAAAEMEARDERAKLEHLYLRGSKYLIIASFPIVFFVIVSAQAILFVWVGSGFDQAAWIIRLLAVGCLFNLIVGVGVSVGMSIERPEFQMKAALISAVSNLVLNVILVGRLGLIGVAVGTSVSLILGPIYFVTKLHKHLQLSSRRVIKSLLPSPLAAVTISSFGIIGMNSLWTAFNLQTTRLTSLFILLVNGILFVIIYGTVLIRQQYLDHDDLYLLKGQLAFWRRLGVNKVKG